MNNISYLLDLPNFSPKLNTDFPYENLRPVVEKIADEIWTWSLPHNDTIPEDKKRFALMWADHVRNEVPSCCVFDALKAFSDLLETITGVLAHCTSHNCSEEGNHDFLEKVGVTIDGYIAEHLRKVAMAQELMRRPN